LVFPSPATREGTCVLRRATPRPDRSVPGAADGPPGPLGSGGSLSWHELQAAGQGPAWRDRDDPRSCDGSPRATFSKIVRAAAFIPTNETNGAPGFPRGQRFRPFYERNHGDGMGG